MSDIDKSLSKASNALRAMGDLVGAGIVDAVLARRKTDRNALFTMRLALTRYDTPDAEKEAAK